MKQELDEALVRDFPHLFADRNGDFRTIAMCWGFECGDGWEPLIRELAEKLEPLCKADYESLTDKDRQAFGHSRAIQVKEKYASLRFYMTCETEEMSKYIAEAEAKSEITCEQCGSQGIIRGCGWLYCSCVAHAKIQDLSENEKTFIKK